MQDNKFFLCVGVQQRGQVHVHVSHPRGACHLPIQQLIQVVLRHSAQGSSGHPGSTPYVRYLLSQKLRSSCNPQVFTPFPAFYKLNLLEESILISIILRRNQKLRKYLMLFMLKLNRLKVR
jgi:hypothetical protein